MYDKRSEALSTDALSQLVTTLAAPSPARDDAERIDRIRHLEELKTAIAAAQARETAAFATSHRAEQLATAPQLSAAGRARHAEASIAEQVALARRCSPSQARRYIGFARTLTADLPGTLAALQSGVTTEAATIAYRLDPAGAVKRRAQAEKDRRVGLRPAPDTMTRLTSLLPLVQGVAAYAALKCDADTKVAAGDSRSRGQIMADTLVERVTGQATADAVPVTVEVIITDTALLAPEGTPGADEPAVVSGHRPIAAGSARDLILRRDAPVWLRRLYTAPGTGELIAMDSQRRCFTPAQRHFIALRDQVCRTSWCEAPIRHTDHIQTADTGGPTQVENGQGYCEACNHAKQAPGWHTNRAPAPGRHTVDLTTPTGHRYRSRAPDPPNPNRWPSPLEIQLSRWLHSAA